MTLLSSFLFISLSNDFYNILTGLNVIDKNIKIYLNSDTK